MLVKTQEVSKTEILNKIYSRNNEESVSFEKAYKLGKDFISKL